METTKTKIANSAKKIGNYLLIIGMLFIGIFIGRTSSNMFTEEVKIEKPKIRGTNDISIAINESNDILLIDKSTGTYDMFTDSIGLTIFRMYAGRIKSSAITN
jgi:hypothetical protein